MGSGSPGSHSVRPSLAGKGPRHRHRGQVHATAESTLSSTVSQARRTAALQLGIVVILLLLAYHAFEAVSSVRAYVGGEGLWSKAQKDAVYHLLRYAADRD